MTPNEYRTIKSRKRLYNMIEYKDYSVWETLDGSGFENLNHFKPFRGIPDSGEHEQWQHLIRSGCWVALKLDGVWTLGCVRYYDFDEIQVFTIYPRLANLSVDLDEIFALDATHETGVKYGDLASASINVGLSKITRSET